MKQSLLLAALLCSGLLFISTVQAVECEKLTKKATVKGLQQEVACLKNEQRKQSVSIEKVHALEYRIKEMEQPSRKWEPYTYP